MLSAVNTVQLGIGGHQTPHPSLDHGFGWPDEGDDGADGGADGDEEPVDTPVPDTSSDTVVDDG